MAGGQERILKGRIRSMQATKKITPRHGADRGFAHRQGPTARAGGCPVLRADHRGRQGPRRRRRVARLAVADRASGDQEHVLRRDHRRPRSVRRLQRRRATGRRGRDQGRRARRQGVRDHPGRPQGRELLQVPRLRARAGVRRVQRPADVRRRQGDRPARRRAVRQRSRRQGRAGLHPLHHARAARRSSCDRSCRCRRTR